MLASESSTRNAPAPDLPSGCPMAARLIRWQHRTMAQQASGRWLLNWVASERDDPSTCVSRADNFPLTRRYHVLDHVLRASVIFHFFVSVRASRQERITHGFAASFWVASRTACRLDSVPDRIICKGTQSTSAIAQRRPQSRTKCRGRCQTRQHRSEVWKPSVRPTTRTPAPHSQLQRKNACRGSRLPASKRRSARQCFDVFPPERASILPSTSCPARSGGLF